MTSFFLPQLLVALTWLAQVTRCSTQRKFKVGVTKWSSKCDSHWLLFGWQWWLNALCKDRVTKLW